VPLHILPEMAASLQPYLASSLGVWLADGVSNGGMGVDVGGGGL
jgi:hypothetical protein